MIKRIALFVLLLFAAALPALPASATVSSTANSVQYAGNGTTRAFAFPLPYFLATDLDVTLFNAATNTYVSPAPVLNGAGTYDYAIAGVSAYSYPGNNVTEYASATITFNTAPPSGYTVIVARALPETQALNLLDNAKFPASSVNASLDRLTLLAQQNAALLGNALTGPASDPSGLSYTLPAQALREGQYLCFDASGNVTSCAPSSGVVVSSAMAPIVASATVTAALEGLGVSTAMVPVVQSATVTAALEGLGVSTAMVPVTQASTLAGAQALLIGAAPPPPHERLTLTSGTPVMTADVVGAGTIYLDPYQGADVPVYNGSVWTLLAVAETSLILDSTGATSGNVYDIFAYGNSGALAIGFGPAWSSSTARGSGSGSTAISLQNGIWVNANAIVLRNNSVNSSSIAAGKATYLGSFYATAAGETSMQFNPAAAAGGSNATLGLYNAYNRIPTRSNSADSSVYTYASATWREADASASNRISYLDGLGNSSVAFGASSYLTGSTYAAYVGALLNATAGNPEYPAPINDSQSMIAYRYSSAPVLGFNFVQGLEAASLGTATYNAFEVWLDVEM